MHHVFGYTFTGLSPLWVGILAVAGAAALLVLYLLRERQRRVRVAFVGLWKASASAPLWDRLGRRWRRWVSLLLQLTLLLLLLLALADPRRGALAEPGRTWLLLVDRSASMSARDGPSHRLESARRLGRRLLAERSPSEPVMVASFARQVAVESEFETDPDRLGKALDRIVPSEEAGDVDKALTFAAAALRDRPRPTLVLVTDGQSEPPRLPAGLAGVDIRFCQVGAPGDNVGWLSLSASRRDDSDEVEIALVARNFSARAHRRVVELREGVSGRLIERMPLTLGANESAERVVKVVTRTPTLEAALLPDLGGADVLDLDNRAFAVIAQPRRRRILVVGEPNLYLDGALLSFGDAVSVKRVPTRSAEASRAAWRDQDVVIFDRTAPSPPPVAGRFIYIDPHGPGTPFPERGLVRDPVLSDVDRQHPLLSHIALADLNIRQARRLLPAPDDQVLAASLGVPLLIARQRPDIKIVALSFDTRQSDLPLRPTFPLLLANAFEWLDPVAAEVLAGHRTGQTARLRLDHAHPSVTIVGPDGGLLSRGVSGPFLELPLSQSGLYRIGSPEKGTRWLAANLFDPSESDTRREPRLIIDEQPIPRWEPSPRSASPSWAFWALLAAALSIFEWWSQQRRWTV